MNHDLITARAPSPRAASAMSTRARPARRVPERLALDHAGRRPARHRPRRRRGVRLRPRGDALLSALDDSRYLLLDACAPQRSLNRALERPSGIGRRHDLDALLAQRLGVLARGPAADAALLDLAVVDAARFFGEALADVLGRAITWRTARSHCDCSVISRAGAGARRLGRRGMARRRSGAARSAAAIAGVAAQRAGDEPRPACDAKSSSEANQPSKRWSWPQRRLSTFMAGIIGTAPSRRRPPLRAASGRRANSATRAGRSASSRR